MERVGQARLTLFLSPTGTRCHLPCPEGFWGANCSNTCTCKNGGTCLPENGNCVCVPGFRGPSCQRREAPSLPPTCQQCGAEYCQNLLCPSCFLPLIPIFGPVGRREGDSGIKGCLPPVTRSPFPPACQPGRYGKRCVPCKCANHSSCHPSNGTCYCLAGWTGSDCSQRTYVACVSESVCVPEGGLRTSGFCSPAPGYKSLWTCLGSVSYINNIHKNLLITTSLLGAADAAMNSQEKQLPVLLHGRPRKGSTGKGVREAISSFFVCLF